MRALHGLQLLGQVRYAVALHEQRQRVVRGLRRHGEVRAVQRLEQLRWSPPSVPQPAERLPAPGAAAWTAGRAARRAQPCKGRALTNCCRPLRLRSSMAPSEGSRLAEGGLPAALLRARELRGGSAASASSCGLGWPREPPLLPRPRPLPRPAARAHNASACRPQMVWAHFRGQHKCFAGLAAPHCSCRAGGARP